MQILFHCSYCPPCKAGSLSLTEEGWCTGERTTSNKLKLRFSFTVLPSLRLWRATQVRRTGKLSLPAETWPALVFLNTSNTNRSNSLLPAAGVRSGTSALTGWAVSAANPLRADHRNTYSFPWWPSRMARAANSELKTQLPSSQSLVVTPIWVTHIPQVTWKMNPDKPTGALPSKISCHLLTHTHCNRDHLHSASPRSLVVLIWPPMVQQCCMSIDNIYNSVVQP